MTDDREPAPAIAMTGVTKRFAGVVANDDVDFVARWCEVHALVGENGAGKSTLMSILAGLYRPDAGQVTISGRPVHLRSPRDAIAHGIGMVHQHFMLVDSFTVAENAILGQPGGGRRLDTATAERELARLGERYGLRIDPRARVWQLSVGEQQRVEIVRLLYRGAKILVFDEPTAVLTPRESTDLIRTLREMAAQGFCIVFISHKLEEVLAVADRITVMRRGRVVATVDAAATDRRALARLMIGRELRPEDAQELLPETTERPAASAPAAPPVVDPVLAIEDLGAVGDKGLPALADVHLAVYPGEILGVAGVAGNGQRELAETITGLRPATAGRVLIDGHDLTNRPPKAIAHAGVAHVPEDRLGTGLVAGLDVSTNAILRDYGRSPLARGPFLAARPIATFVDRLVTSYDIKTPGRRARVRGLSGGNQQKLLLARELSGNPRLLVAVHPTRGVDIGATETIHRLLREQRANGLATLLISEDLDELLALADRIAVLYEGRVMGIVAAKRADREEIGLMMAGVSVETNPARTRSTNPVASGG